MVGRGFDHGVCIVLAPAVLWRMFDSSGDGLVPDCIHSHLVGAHSDLGQWNALENSTNPVKKVLPAVDGHDLEVIVDEIIGGDVVRGEVGGEGDGDVHVRLGLRHYAFLPRFSSSS